MSKVGKVAFVHTGNSANIHFYKQSGLGSRYYVEVLRDDIERLAEGKVVPRKVPIFRFTVLRKLAPGGYTEQVRFNYEPKRRPSTSHLPNSTVTRLVREHLTAG